MVEGAVLAFTFVADTFALVLALMFVLTFVLTVVPRAHAFKVTTPAEMTNNRIRTGGLTSVFFIVAFSERFASVRDVV